MGYTFTNEWVHDLDRWLTTDPRDEIEPVCTCSECDGEIYEGDTYYEVKGNIYCEECMEGFKKEAERDYPDYIED